MTDRIFIPSSQSLEWVVENRPDNTQSYATAVSQPGLQKALSGQSEQGGGLLSGLQAITRSRKSTTTAKRELSAPAFDKMKRIEAIQHRVSELVPHRPNNVSSIVASDGEAFHRHEMRLTTEEVVPQYSAASARQAIRWGTGVCTDVNNVLFRALAADASDQAKVTMRDRASGRSTHVAQLPVLFAKNDDPHDFVLVGDPRDPRQAADVLVGDSWEALPIVKTWTNTGYNDRPYQVKMQAVAGGSSYQDLALTASSEAASERVATQAVDQHLRQQGRPPIGRELLLNVHDICRQFGVQLFDRTTTAQVPVMQYQNAADGDIFTPSLSVHDYQNYRAALSKTEVYASFKELQRTQ